jgi:hypothetical protein
MKLTPEQEKGTHGSCATIVVRSKASGDDIVINEHDFDPELYEMTGEAQATPKKTRRPQQ